MRFDRKLEASVGLATGYARVGKLGSDDPRIALAALPVILLVLIVGGAVYGERATLLDYLAQVGLIATLFCVISLSVGYAVPRMVGLGEAQAIASSFEIGIHNATLAIAMAVTVLQSTEMAVPPAIYGVVMFTVAAAFGVFFTRGSRARDLEAVSATQRESAA